MADTIILTELLDNEQTAALLGIKPNTLAIWRLKGKGPCFVKLGTAGQSPVRYQHAEVTRWLREQSFVSTAAYSPAGRSNTTRLVSPPPCGSV
jgi:hypothetical protein